MFFHNTGIFNTPSLRKKWSFSLRIPSVNVTKSAVTFTEEILDGKLHFSCSDEKN